MSCAVEAVDRNAAALATLAEVPGITTRLADLEADAWPYTAASFDGVVVTNYLHRPRFAALLNALRPGGVLIYETFMVGNETLGRPSNPDFLLRPGELLALVSPRMTVVAFEQGHVDTPRPAFIQRICAVAAEISSLPS
jgi:SAM-dependent methyltransferase